MKTLIIGGSGHVSGAVARVALAQGHQVWTVTRGQRPLPEGVNALTADRNDADAFRAAITGADMQWDLVVDCICYQPEDMDQDLALFPGRAKQFVFVSTDFVFDPARRVFPQPQDGITLPAEGCAELSYGQRKRVCELKLMNADTGEMKWTIVRPCHIYGAPSQLGCLPLHSRDEKLIARLRDGEALCLVGGGHFLQQPVLARDLAELIMSIAGNERSFNEVFNTAGPEIVESRKYYQIIADVLGVGLTVEEVSVQEFLAKNPDKAPFCCHRVYDLAKLRASGLKVPSTGIEQGLREHVRALAPDSSEVIQ